jgi:transcriptional antiterminator Rof (Rho-off)
LLRIIHHRDCGRTGDGHVALASEDITLSMEDPDLVRARAETLFKRKEKQEKQRLEGEQAMAEYVAEKQAMSDNMARLRALRLARDAAKEAAAGSRKRAG